ncbi:Ferritin-3, chloroplastic [Portunus trituberculatus]|uniref:Ferritin n=1 Tax=Portunus trituberculatus TaxID=210409 RepID=A0A5B7GNQ8_PORTR|nr:Ferritin-3, chloroplastic [Portunus trituberculatus]
MSPLANRSQVVVGKPSYPSRVCYNETCMNTITDHIAYEFQAAFKYLYMGAVFGQYIKERQGMAKFFLEAATEERGHAIQMMDYLNMRGFQYNKNYEFSKDNVSKKKKKRSFILLLKYFLGWCTENFLFIKTLLTATHNFKI